MTERITDIPAYLRGLLPAGVPVRRDRGEALYVLPAARVGSTETLYDAGFTVSFREQLLAVTPSEALLRRFAALPCDSFLARSLERTECFPYSAEAIACVCEGIKLLEAPTDTGMTAYEVRVRRCAAVALREHTGGARLCAALLHAMPVTRE